MDVPNGVSKAQTISERSFGADAPDGLQSVKRRASEPSTVYLTVPDNGTNPTDISKSEHPITVSVEEVAASDSAVSSLEPVEAEEQDLADEFLFGRSPPLYVKKRKAYSKLAVPQCSPIFINSTKPEVTIEPRNSEAAIVTILESGGLTSKSAASSKLVTITNLVKIRSNGKISDSVFPGSDVESSGWPGGGERGALTSRKTHLSQAHSQLEQEPSPDIPSTPRDEVAALISSPQRVSMAPTTGSFDVGSSSSDSPVQTEQSGSCSDSSPINMFFSGQRMPSINEPTQPFAKPSNIREHLIDQPTLFGDRFQDYMEERLIRFKANDSQHNPNLNHPYTDPNFGSSSKEANGSGLFGWLSGTKTNLSSRSSAFHPAAELDALGTNLQPPSVDALPVKQGNLGHDLAISPHDPQHPGFNTVCIPHNSSNSMFPAPKTIDSAAAAIIPQTSNIDGYRRSSTFIHSNYTPEAIPFQFETDNELLDLINQNENFMTSCFSSFVNLFRCS